MKYIWTLKLVVCTWYLFEEYARMYVDKILKIANKYFSYSKWKPKLG